MGRPKGKIQLVADAAGLDQSTVRRAMKTAGLDIETLDFDKAVEIVRASADPLRVMGHALNGRGVGGHGTDGFAEAKATSERHRARKLEIQNAQLEASLISREAVNATCTYILSEIRAAVAPLGYRLAEKLLGVTDPKVFARVVEAEVRAVLGTLADEDRFFKTIEDEALA